MKELIGQAIKAREKAYAPYSSFKVGAALRTSSGEIISGCNVENAAYSLTNCAERTALFCAIVKGHSNFTELAVVGDTKEPISPCGACRQVLVEFCSHDMKIYLANMQGDVKETTVAQLLPDAFSKEDLASG